MTVLPWRGDVAEAECTRDPIFLLQRRALHLTQVGLPDGVGIDDDGDLVTIVSGCLERVGLDWLYAHFPESVLVIWQTAGVFFTRPEAERSGSAQEHNFGGSPACWRVYCVCAEGELAALLRTRSMAPSGDLTRAPRTRKPKETTSC